jgi:hypothetical protein
MKSVFELFIYLLHDTTRVSTAADKRWAKQVSAAHLNFWGGKKSKLEDNDLY